MKTFFPVGIAVVLSLVPSSPAEAQVFSPPDPSPRTAIETIELEPGRLFECLVLETTPGVSYVIEVSDDLIEWEQLGDSHFGLGHQIVTPMVERSSAPPSGNPPPNPSPPALLPKMVSLILRPATTGGLIASFRSMDSTGTIIRHFPDLELSSEWQLLPLYVSTNFSNHTFIVWHPGVPQSPPALEQVPGPLDQATLAIFEDHFEEMDLEVQASVARSRNQPPAPPPVPGQRRFYRVTGDAGGDADGDGTPDWLEFALIAAGGQAAAGADPFNPDTNGNGTADGAENDSDEDGTPDVADAAPGDAAVNWQPGDHLLFAFFPVSGTGRIAHVNDKGRVLYANSVWSNGVPLPLSPTSGNLLRNCEAIGIGDNGFILGIGEIDLPDDTGASWSPCMVTWPEAGGDPVPLTAGENQEKYLIPVSVIDVSSQTASFPVPSDTNVNSEGKFVAHVGQVVSVPGQGGNYFNVQLDEAEEGAARKIWQGTAGNSAVTQVAAAGETTVWIADNGLESGVDDFGQFKVGGELILGPMRRIVTLPGGGIGAFLRDGNDARGVPPKILLDSTWKDSTTLQPSIDISTERLFALSYPWEIWLNGKDIRPAHEFAPGLPAFWRGGGASLADTTRNGWTLAVNTGPPAEAMLAMPLQLSTDVPASGVDNQSAAARDSKVPVIQAGNRDEYWAMVPAGGSTVVRLKSTASSSVPLLIDQTGTVKSDPVSLTGPDQILELSAPNTAYDKEFNLPFKIGAVASASAPIRVKVMKPRVVNVSIWPLKRPGFSEVNPPINLPPLPTEEQIEEYLNGVYKPQIAVTFNVTIKDESVMAADPGLKLDPVTTPLSTFDALTAEKTEGNIQVFITGGYERFGVLDGWTRTGGTHIFLPIGLLVGGAAAEKEQWLNSMAHEIGHVFWGSGHPNDRPDVGKAALPGTDLSKRLMATFRAGGPPPKLIVKAEWDAAEDWLKLNVDP